jgi:dihydrofolate synthase/folylpolyglutamate synthase
MTYHEAIQFLYELRWRGLKLGLEHAQQLTELAGRPDRQLRFIHVAGTNGKGSTCAMLESIYRAAGYRTGLFTSPHLVSFRERIQVARIPIAPDDVVRLVATAQRWLRSFPADQQPTFFEVLTVMALVYFAERSCDVVIWETGLGGRLDATNIVDPLASVITNIQLDHEKWLGHTIREIAREKGGIIKPGRPVLTAADHPEALPLLREMAGAAGAPFTHVKEDSRWIPEHASIGLPGHHQRRNAALAVATVQALQSLLPVHSAAVLNGLAKPDWPGRLQSLRGPRGQHVLLDGAHNPAGAAALRRAIDDALPGQPITLILGILQDKDWRLMCHALGPRAEHIFLVPVKTDRSATPHELSSACIEAAPDSDVVQCTSLANAFDQTAPDATVVIAGSLYLVGEALEYLGAAPVDAASERDLNDWTQPTLRQP